MIEIKSSYMNLLEIKVFVLNTCQNKRTRKLEVQQQVLLVSFFLSDFNFLISFELFLDKFLDFPRLTKIVRNILYGVLGNLNVCPVDLVPEFSFVHMVVSYDKTRFKGCHLIFFNLLNSMPHLKKVFLFILQLVLKIYDNNNKNILLFLKSFLLTLKGACSGCFIMKISSNFLLFR